MQEPTGVSGEILDSSVGKYELLRPLGGGEYGFVWLAKDLDRPQEVALKILKTETWNPTEIDRFKREFEILTGLKHRNLARVFDFGYIEKKNVYFFTSEFAPGTDFFLATEGHSVQEIEELLVEILSALDFIHSQGIIHRDLKAQNILVDLDSEAGPESSLKIVDFGLAVPSHTMPRERAGTLAYMAPEVLSRQSRTDHRIDLYSLGMLLLKSLTRRWPFDARKPDEVVDWHLHGAIFEDLWPDSLPRHLREIVAKLLEKNPSDRFSHPRVVLNFLNLATGNRYEKKEHELRGLVPVEGPLVGRSAHLGALRDRFQKLFFSASADPVSSVAYVTGEPGIGKSRILDEFRKFVELHEVPVRELTCQWQVPTWPRIEEIFSLREQAMISMAELSFEEGLSKDWLIRRRASEILERSRSQPLCLLIDDFDKVDPDTERLIEEIDRRARFERREGRGVALLVVAASEKQRPGGILLPHLSVDGIRQYLAQILGETDALKEVAHLLHSYSGGLPLLVVEGLRFLAPHLFRGASGRELEGLLPPPEIASLYRDRLASLPPGERDLLKTVSLFFRPVSLDEITGTAEDAGDDIDKLLRLERQGFVRQEGTQGGRYRVASQALAIDLINSLDPAERASRHRRIAQTLKTLTSAPMEEIAYHWAKAQNPEEALAAYRQAASRFALLGQVGAATECLEKAIGLVPHGDALRDDLILETSRLLVLTGAYPRAEELLAEAERSSPLRSELSAWLSFKRRDFPRAAREYETALGLLATDEKSALFDRVRLKNALGNVSLQAGDVKEAIRLFEEGLSLEESLSPEQALQITNNNLGLALSLKGETTQAVRFFERRLARRGEKRLPPEQVALYNGLGYVLLQGSQYPEATEALKKAFEIAESSGTLHMVFTILGNLITSLLKESRYAEALEALERLLNYQQKLATPRDIAFNLLRQASLSLTLGLVEQARESLEKGRRIASEAADPALEAWMDLMTGYLLREEGQTSEARALLQRTLEKSRRLPDRSLSAWSLYTIADLLCDEGRSAEARVKIAELPPDNRDAEFTARLEILEARLLLAEGEFQAVASHAQSLEERCLREGFRDLMAEIYPIWAEAAWRSGNQEQAHALLEKGRALVESIAQSLPEEYQDRYRTTRSRRKIYEDFQQIEGGTVMAGEQMKMLLEINKRMVSERDPNRLLEFIMDTAIQLSQAEEGLLLLTNEQGAFETRIARNIQQENIEIIKFSRSIAEKVVSSGQSLYSPNALDDQRLKSLASVASLELKTVSCFPLKIQNRTTGVIYLATRQREGSLKREDLPVLESFADQAATALQNAWLFEEKERYRRKLEDDLDETKKILEEKEEHLQELEALVSKGTRKTLFPYEQIIGRSKKMEEVLRTLDKVTNAQVPVFIYGDTGTGKELLARALHHHSIRRQKSFLAINCSAFTETILESELFGYNRGAFTGADRDRKGLFEEADGGTLFLDEVADMSLTMQAKILRVIQEQEVLRIGGRTTIKINVRIVSASNKDLKKMVREGKFREDLYYRVAGITITLPPLRERKEDIPLLVQHFIQKIRKENKLPKAPRLSRDALTRLMLYDWPGNIRELEQCLTNACLMCEGNAIQSSHILLQKDLYEPPSEEPQGPTARGNVLQFSPEKKLDDYEREIIAKQLEACSGNKSEAARRLGISRLTLHKKIKEYSVA